MVVSTGLGSGLGSEVGLPVGWLLGSTLGSARDSVIARVPCAHASCGSTRANAWAVSSGALCARDLVSWLVFVLSVVGSVVVVSEGAWSCSRTVVGFVKKERSVD